MKKDSGPEIISQWHQSPDRDEGETWTGAGPALSLSLKNGMLGLNYKWDTRRIIVKGDGVKVKNSGISLGVASQNRWIDFVFHIKWDPFGKGILQVWQDNNLVLDKIGIALGYNDNRNPYWKLGIYKYTGKSDYTSRILYFDEIRIGGPKATYDDVAPGKKDGADEGWQRGKLIYQDDFDGTLRNWVPEVQHPGSSSVGIKNRRLEAIIKVGATIWFKPVLSGNIQIEYTAICLSHTEGANMNAFWMATDPKNSNLFTRKGDFPEYDHLKLYYGSLGGNGNITNRFRKYLGNGSKPLLKEYTDSAHFPVVNKPYKIKLLYLTALSNSL